MLGGTVSLQIVKSDFLSHRMSDVKTNEYADLTGVREFESEESNPVLGFQETSLYYSYHCRQRLSKSVYDSQTLSGYPEFEAFPITTGIDSISPNPEH